MNEDLIAHYRKLTDRRTELNEEIDRLTLQQTELKVERNSLEEKLRNLWGAMEVTGVERDGLEEPPQLDFTYFKKSLKNS
jgi:chromosome segregation ATPase